MKFSPRSLRVSARFLILFLIPTLITFALVVFLLLSREDITTTTWIIVSVAAVLVVISLVMSLTFSGQVSKSLAHLAQSADDVAQGKFEARPFRAPAPDLEALHQSLNRLKSTSHTHAQFAAELSTKNLQATYALSSEHDAIGKALTEIRDALIRSSEEDQQREWTASGLSTFVEVLQSAEEVKTLAQRCIVTLVKIVKANQGGIFLLAKDDAGQEYLDLMGRYAYERVKFGSHRIEMGEGLVGQAFLEKRTIYLTKVPDKFVKITSGLGGATPRFVLLVPLRLNDDVVGVIELASFHDFKKHVIDFVEKIGENIAHTVTSRWTADRTKQLLDESQSAAEQMRAQEEELRQNQEELQATQEEISRKYDTLFRQLGELNHESKFDQLKSINATRKRSVEYYFEIIRNQVHTFSEDLMVVNAVKDFRAAFYHITEEISIHPSTIQDRLTEYYQQEFIPRLNENLANPAKAASFIPNEPRVALMQFLYIADNGQATGKKHLMNDAGDGSDYSAVHAKYHPSISKFLDKFGYYDIFLIDAKTGDMLYSVFKEVDFATSLLHGPYSNTNFGNVVRAAIESTDKDFVRLVDFEPYDPSYNAPASFIASPVYDGDDKIGVLVFQMPINRINQILTGNNHWREDGLGTSGETRIVGSDFLLRSMSREFVEFPERYLAGLERIGYDHQTLKQIRKMETTILLVRMQWDAVTKGLRGQTGTQLERNAFGEEVLAAYAPLSIQDVHWTIVSSVKEEEVSDRINSLRQ